MLNESGQDVDVDQPHQNDEDLYIAYSIKIMTALEAKQKSHNEENNSKKSNSYSRQAFSTC